MNNEKVEIVETHIETNGGFGFATKDSYDEWKKSGHVGYMTSLTRLVILKYKKTGEIISFLMTIVGDKEYLKKKEFKLWSNTYLVKDKDFNGLILFHNLDGVFVNGWRYTHGRPTHTVTVNFEQELVVQLKSGYYDCSTYEVYGWVQECTDNYTVGEVDGQIISITYTGTSCDAPYMDYAGTMIACTYVEEVEDGGGGGFNDPDGNSNIPCLGDPVRNPEINPTIIGNTVGGLYGCTRTTSNPNCTNDPYNTMHNGVDIVAPVGSNIYSMYPGDVLHNGYEENGLGNYTVIRSEIEGETVDIYYGHLNYATLEPGSIVNNATVIGIAGQTGNAEGTNPHVHIKLKENGMTKDPLFYFATEFDQSDGSVSSVCN